MDAKNGDPNQSILNQEWNFELNLFVIKGFHNTAPDLLFWPNTISVWLIAQETRFIAQLYSHPSCLPNLV